MLTISKHLSPKQLITLKSICRIFHNAESFREDALTHIDRILDYMNEKDLKDLKLLISLLRLLPNFLLSTVVKKFSHSKVNDLRLAYFGLRGIAMTLQYSDNSPKHNTFQQMNWHTQCVTDSELQAQKDLSALDLCAQEYFETAKRAEYILQRTSIEQRLENLRKLKQLILARQEEMVSHIVDATGKCKTDALMSEIFPILDHIDFLISTSKNSLKEKTVKTPLALLGKRSFVQLEALGTVLIICPWNYPLYQALVTITWSYICGNATIYKPSEQTPMKGLLEEVLLQSGFLDGSVQIAYGDGKMAEALINRRPDKIFFIGSTRTGKKIMAQSSLQLIPLELELGGKDPMIVFEDANILRAAAGALWGSITNTGQSCTSVERIYVHTKIYQIFRETLCTLSSALEYGRDYGLMINERQCYQVREQIDDAQKLGATITPLGMNLNPKTLPTTGVDRFIQPTLIENVTDDMLLMKEETFGPLVVLIPFSSEEEAISEANHSDYGLSASVWSADKEKARRVSAAIKTGNVSINNVMLTEGNHYLPFGGIKNSGFGRFKGNYGFTSFSNTKSIIVDANSEKIEANWFPYTAEKYQLFANMMQGLFHGGIKGLIKFALNGLRLESLSTKLVKLTIKK